MDHPLIKFCESDLQRIIVEEVIVKGRPLTQVARECNSAERTARHSKQRLLAKAAKQGYSPEHHWNHPVPDGHKIKGVSTFYDEDGKPVRQWVKSQTDEQRQFEILVERIENAQEGLKSFKPTKPPKTCDDNLLTLLTLTDFHLGMYALKPRQARTGI